MTSHYLSSDETAQKLGISVDELNELREAYKLRGFRDGSGWKYRGEDVEKYLSIRDDSRPGSEFGLASENSEETPGFFNELDEDHSSSSSEIPLTEGSGSFSAFLMDESPSSDNLASKSGDSASMPLADSSSSIDIAKAMEKADDDQLNLNLVDAGLFEEELNVDDTGSGSIDPEKLMADGDSGSLHLIAPSAGGASSGDLELASAAASEANTAPEEEFSLAVDDTPVGGTPAAVEPEIVLDQSAEVANNGASVSVSLDKGEELKVSSGIDSGLTLDESFNEDENVSSDAMSLDLDDSDLLTLDDLGDGNSGSSSMPAKPLEEFSLTPDVNDEDSEEDSASSSQVIPLDLPDGPTATIATGTPTFTPGGPTTAAGSVLDDPFGGASISPAGGLGTLGADSSGLGAFGGSSELGAAGLDTGLGAGLGAAGLGAGLDSGLGATSMGGASVAAMGAAPTGAVAPVMEAPYSGLQITSLVCCSLLLFLDCWLLYDLVSVFTTDHQASAVSAMLLELLSGLF